MQVFGDEVFERHCCCSACTMSLKDLPESGGFSIKEKTGS